MAFNKPRYQRRYYRLNKEALLEAANHYYHTNKPRILKRHKQRRKSDPQFRKYSSDKAKKWRRQNPEKARENSIKSTRETVAVRKDYVNHQKNKPCKDCKKRFPTVCMDFDHLPGFRKKKIISSMIRDGSSLQDIQKEIGKCELVCACCHRLRGLKRFSER